MSLPTYFGQHFINNQNNMLHVDKVLLKCKCDEGYVHVQWMYLSPGFYSYISAFLNMLWIPSWSMWLIIDLLHKCHNASVPYATMHHFVTEMCTHVHISVTKRCIVGYLSNALWDLWGLIGTGESYDCHSFRYTTLKDVGTLDWYLRLNITKHNQTQHNQTQQNQTQETVNRVHNSRDVLCGMFGGLRGFRKIVHTCTSVGHLASLMTSILWHRKTKTPPIFQFECMYMHSNWNFDYVFVFSVWNNIILDNAIK